MEITLEVNTKGIHILHNLKWLITVSLLIVPQQLNMVVHFISTEGLPIQTLSITLSGQTALSRTVVL